MKSFEEIIAEFLSQVDCHFYPAKGLPRVRADLDTPADLLAFYERFGEARLFEIYWIQGANCFHPMNSYKTVRRLWGESRLKGSKELGSHSRMFKMAITLLST